MVTHVFDDSNLSQEIFAIDTWGAVICSLGHGRKRMLTTLQALHNSQALLNLRRGYFRCQSQLYGIYFHMSSRNQTKL